MTILQTQAAYKIGDVQTLLGISADTLRYYEKIGLLPPVQRTASGMRRYLPRDISNLRFIQRAKTMNFQRAKTMNFSLDEIAQLLMMRQDPQNVRSEVRELTRTKLAEIESHLRELGTLKNELTLLVNLCQSADDGCPILDEIQSGKPA